MEEITKGVNAMNISTSDSYKKNRIQVSNTKKPLFFYVNLAKIHDEAKKFAHQTGVKIVAAYGGAAISHQGAKENFELALEADNTNMHARYWLARLHLKYHVPGACKAVGAALLVESANMGQKDAQYELGCRMRMENPYVQSDQQAFYYIEKAADQM